MRWLSRIVTIAIIVALVTAAAIFIVTRVRQSTPGGGFETSAAFRDASRLPVGSRVMVAGVHVGQITALAIDGRLGRVHMRLADDVELWDNAWAEKKAESLFGDGYIEIHPGGPGPGRRRLVSGEPILQVVDEVSTDRTLRELDQSLPPVQGALVSADEFFDGARRTINGPVADALASADRATASVDDAPFRRLDEALTRLDTWSADTAAATAGQAPRVNRALDDFARDVGGLTADMRQGNQDLREAFDTAQKRIDEVDPYLEEAAEVIARLDGRVPAEEQGTMGRLINDDELGDTLDDATEGAKDFTGTLGRLETFVGLRAEYSIFARQSRIFVGATISGRRDSFYVFEVGKYEAGGEPEVALTDVPGGDDRFVRTAVIRDELRMTAQWGRRIGALAFRFGLKDSKFGIGADAVLLGGRLELASDVLLPSYQRVPQLKLAAALRVFESIYVSAGVDDVFLAPAELPIQAGSDDVPTQLRDLRYGRDLFGGVFFRFDDKDLDRLLLVYGAVIFAAL